MFLILYHEKSVAENFPVQLRLLELAIDNNFPLSVPLSTLEMTSKKSFEHLDVISMVDKDKDRGKLLSICFFNNIDSFDVHLR